MVYYTGVLYPARNGHYTYLNGGPCSGSTRMTPWSIAHYPLREFSVIAESRMHYGYSDRDQTEGVIFTEVCAGWRLVAMWDRSADPRRGGNATFAVDTESLDAALREIQRYYRPTVARIERHVGIPLENFRVAELLDEYPDAPGSTRNPASQQAQIIVCPHCQGRGVVPKS